MNQNFIEKGIFAIEVYVKLLEGAHKERSKRLIQSSNQKQIVEVLEKLFRKVQEIDSTDDV